MGLLSAQPVFSDIGDKVDNPVGITPLVVIPADDLDQLAVQDHG